MNLDGSWNRGQASWSLGFLHTYQITMFVGILISFLTIVWFWKRQKYSWQILQILVIIIVPTSIVGARLWFLIASGDRADWAHFYQMDGLSIHGGVLFSTAAAMWFLTFRRKSVNLRIAFGIILPAVLIGQSIGRFGNMDNHEVYGRIVENGSDLNWMGAMKQHMFIEGHYRMPLFFIESMTNLAGYLLIVWVILNFNLVKPGITGAFYLIWYGIVRVSMEPLRDPVDIMKWGDFPVSVLLSVLSIVAGLVLIVWWQGLTKPFDKWFANIMPKEWMRKAEVKVKVRYKLITPIKPRRFAGGKETRKQFYLFGKEVKNRIRVWLPDYTEDTKTSKRKLNSDWSRRT